MTANGTPLEDTIAEARRVADAAHAQKLGVKLLGGAGIHLHSPSAQHPPLKRKYGDLDYVISTKDRKRALAFFPALGYEANDRFNLMQGDRRLYFYDGSNGKQVDVFIDEIRMSHVIDLRGRLSHEGPCASPADLLLSKMQIYEVNRKDMVDLTALLLDHPIKPQDDEAIDPTYVARLAADHHHFRILVDGDEVGMEEDRPEAAGEGLVLGDVEFLVAEEHDAMLVQRVADLADRAVVERLGEVDAEQLGAAGAGDRPHLDLAVAHQDVSFRSSSPRFHLPSVAAAS